MWKDVLTARTVHSALGANPNLYATSTPLIPIVKYIMNTASGIAPTSRQKRKTL